QLSAEPHHRPPRQRDAASARPSARRRPRSDRRRAGDEGAARGAGGRAVRLAEEDTGATTVGQALASSVARLRAAGVPEPEAAAQALLARPLAPRRARP